MRFECGRKERGVDAVIQAFLAGRPYFDSDVYAIEKQSLACDNSHAIDEISRDEVLRQISG